MTVLLESEKKQLVRRSIYHITVQRHYDKSCVYQFVLAYYVLLFDRVL